MFKKSIKYFKCSVAFLLILSSIYSCSVQKRYHRRGYTITWKKNERVKVNHERKNTIIERTTSNKRTVLAQSDSVQLRSQNSTTLSNESEYVFNENGVLKNKEKQYPQIKMISHKELKTVLFSNSRTSTFQKVIIRNSATNKITNINSGKRDFERAGRDLGLAGVFLLLGIIIAGIGVLFSLEVLAIVSFVCFCIAGLFFMLCLFEGLISLLTFGML
jgi:hypothetical protein